MYISRRAARALMTMMTAFALGACPGGKSAPVTLAVVNARMFISRSASPVSRVMLCSASPAIATQLCPAASP